MRDTILRGGVTLLTVILIFKLLSIMIAIDICQIRLDFVNMVLGNPAAATGECDAAGDNLVIAAGATNLLGPSTPPTLCGTNTGQHGNISIKLITKSWVTLRY